MLLTAMSFSALPLPKGWRKKLQTKKFLPFFKPAIAIGVGGVSGRKIASYPERINRLRRKGSGRSNNHTTTSQF
ncbi:hypothetical protein DHB64_17130 [Antarcticibacterium sp. W02-3]|nr:hypothetical protein [Antarcticibacterium sp. W02-3]